MAIKILFLEDNPADFELISEYLLSEGIPLDMVRAQGRIEFEAAIEKERFDLILSDFTLPGYSGFAALKFVRERDTVLPFILLSGTLSEEEAVTVLKAGATDYIIKQRLNRLAPAIQRALEEAQEHRARQRAEEQIRNQAALLDKARDAIVLVDMEQRILYWNRSAERIFGWNANEALGQQLGAFLLRGGAAGGEATINRLLSENEWRGELPIQTKFGKRIVIESRWSLMHDPESPAPKGILLINTDITDKKEIEAQFLRTQRIQTIGALSGGIAHDLNNALAPIVMAAELLGDEILNESGQRMLEMIRSSAKRCADMVKQILSFSRGTGQAWELLQPCKIIEELAGLTRETFPRLITIQTQCEPGLNPIYGNLTQIHQVIMNLLVNARDAMPRGGTITISTNNVLLHNRRSKMLPSPVNGPFVSISVSDTGTGIPPEIVDRIFEPFFTTKDVGKGTGLGLSTVFSIVKSHDGFLELRTEVGKGTTFDLFFPAQVARAAAAPKPAPETALAARGERLLVVDDEAGLLAIVKTTLETLGFEVFTASDGLEALAVLEKPDHKIDVILTDWVMPLMSGAELVRRIRAAAPDIKIVVVTGSGALDDFKIPEKVDGVLQKPYTTENLLAAIHEALGKPSPVLQDH